MLLVACHRACLLGSNYFPLLFFSLAPYFTVCDSDPVRIWSHWVGAARLGIPARMPCPMLSQLGSHMDFLGYQFLNCRPFPSHHNVRMDFVFFIQPPPARGTGCQKSCEVLQSLGYFCEIQGKLLIVDWTENELFLSFFLESRDCCHSKSRHKGCQFECFRIAREFNLFK